MHEVGTMGFDFENEAHALICGASKGIGRGAALAVARLGVKVTVLARSGDLLRDLEGELRRAGARGTRAIVADLDHRDALFAQVESLIRAEGPIHILLNNTGGPAAGPLVEAQEGAFLQAFERHVLVSHGLVRRVLPGMALSGYGRIINVLSSSVREPIPGLGVSNTIRGAMASWSKSLSRELPPSVTINNVLPGKIDTGRLSELKVALAQKAGASPEEIEATWLANIPEGRLGTPEEIGRVIAFLASPAASFVRGVSLPVDGGQLAVI
jgi:3-oxoacyl-[acyl-carrier protein] reductase